MNLLRGEISSSIDDQPGLGIKSIAAGSEVVVECAGQWRQDVHITASLLKGEEPLTKLTHPVSQMDGAHVILSEKV